jgi:hypothetical protein
MTTGFERVTARRVWFVPSFIIWGLPVWEEVEFLTVEKVGSDETVLYGSLDIGGTVQQVVFSDLTDHRGNQLPPAIVSPRIIIRPRSNDTAFIISEESGSTFKIARDPDASGPVTVDLLVVEMGD